MVTVMNKQVANPQEDKYSGRKDHLEHNKRLNLVALGIASFYALALGILYFWPCCKIISWHCANQYSVSNDLFVVLGIVNFTYPYVVAVRGTKLYGVSMSRVMYSQLRWHWCLYFVYAVLDILGLLYASSSRQVGAWCCLAGMLTVLITILYTVVTYIFKPYNSRHMIDEYMADWIKREKEGDEACINAGDYLRTYFLSSQTVSVPVASTLFASLETRPFSLDGVSPKGGLPFVLLCYSGQCNSKSLGAPDVAADSVFRARVVFDRIFREMSVFQQTTLLKQLLLVLATDFSNSKEGSGPVLCGLAAWLRESVTDRRNFDVWKQNWELLLDRLLRASIYSQAEISWKEAPGYKAVLRRLVLLIRASALVDMTTIYFSDEEHDFNAFLAEKMELIFEHFDIPDGDEIDFYPWGQVIVHAAHDPDYNPERSCVSSYALLSCWEALRESENAEII